MKHIVSMAAVLVAMSLASTASAQVQTGSILVKATDEQGASTPGVAVTITSGVLVGGTTTGVTDVGGIYLPGALQAHAGAGLRGFQTIIRENVQVESDDDAGQAVDEGRERQRSGHRHRRRRPVDTTSANVASPSPRVLQ
jgi:hypothetical protein